MNLSRKTRTIIVLVIGIAFILFGLSQALFSFEVNEKIVNEVSFVLMLIAAFLILGGRKTKNRDIQKDATKSENNDSSDFISESTESAEDDSSDT